MITLEEFLELPGSDISIQAFIIDEPDSDDDCLMIKYNALPLPASVEEDPVIDNGIDICDIYAVSGTTLIPGRRIAYTEYRFEHNPPGTIARDLKYGTDGDAEQVISWWNRFFWLDADEIALEAEMRRLL